jgi:hypothetical protein
MTTTTNILDAVADDAATMNSWSDRNPATIVKRTPKTIWVQDDRATNICAPDTDGYAQGHGDVIVFARDYDAPIHVYSLRANGRWIAKGAPAHSRGASLTIGRRDYYRDPSF